MSTGDVYDGDRCGAAFFSIVGGVVIGAAVGAALGLLFAPTSGEELRAKLQQQMREHCPCLGAGPDGDGSASETEECCPGGDDA